MDMWLEENHFKAHEKALVDMTLQEFCVKHKVGSRNDHRNKIKIDNSKAKVIRFVPNYPHSPESPTFVEYCKHALMKYKAWEGHPSTCWGGKEATDEDILGEWEAFCEERGKDLPDVM